MNTISKKNEESVCEFYGYEWNQGMMTKVPTMHCLQFFTWEL